MIPSEAAISRAIDALSPGPFQRLAEQYAQVRYGPRFRDLIPRGRTVNDQTRAGWGDGCVILPDGKVDVVEATRDARWERHLRSDVAKAEALGEKQLAGFVFVAWAATPEQDEIKPWYERLAALGIPADRTALVFRDELVRRIADPSCAAIWSSILGLPGNIHPFVELEKAPVFGSDDLERFVPTLEEHHRGLVHRPASADVVESRLKERGWAFVRGHGAAGKTVLAVQIGLAARKSSAPAYYLDLAPLGGNAGGGDVRPVLDTIATRSAPNVVFIVDNVHRAGGFARTVFDYWSEVGSGSRLLLLGRWTEKGAGVRGLADSLDEMNSAAVELRVEARDLRGVLHRLLSREGRRVPARLRDRQLADWLETFGGDMVAFAFAAAGRLRAGDTEVEKWNLGPADAREYVRLSYLSTLDEGQCRALKCMAVLSTLELPAAAGVLDPAAIESALEEGLVIRVAMNDGAAQYQLVHPGIGSLVLGALGVEHVDDDFEQIARAHPWMGLQIAIRLRAEQRIETAARVFRAATSADGELLRALTTGDPQLVGEAIWLALELGSQTSASIDAELAAGMDRLAPRVFMSSLPGLATMMAVCSRELPRAHEALMAAMRDERNLAAVRASILEPDAKARAITTVIVAIHDSPTAGGELIADLSSPAVMSDLARNYLRLGPKALTNSLGALAEAPIFGEALGRALTSNQKLLDDYVAGRFDRLAPLLSYGHHHPALAVALKRSLSSAAVRERIFDAFRRGEFAAVAEVVPQAEHYCPDFKSKMLERFDDPEFAFDAIQVRLRRGGAPLKRLLKGTKKSFPTLGERVRAALNEDEPYVAAVAETCVEGKADSMAQLLRLLLEEAPDLHRRVVSALESPAYEDRLVECLQRNKRGGVDWILRSPGCLPLLESICRPDGILETIVSPAGRIKLLPALSRTLKGPAKAAKRAVVVAGLFDASMAGEWQRSAVSIDHVASALMLADSQPLAERLGWLRRLVALDGWSGLRIDWTDRASTLTPLLNLWLTQEEEIVDFVRARIRGEGPTALPRSSDERPSGARILVRAVGVARLYGVAAIPSEAPGVVASALTHRQPHGRAWMTHAEAQLWLGVLAIDQFHQLVLPPDQLRSALALLRNSISGTPREDALQRELEEWLAAKLDEVPALPGPEASGRLRPGNLR